MVILKNLKNRKIYDTLDLYIQKLCELQLNVVANPAAIKEREFYAMFLEELFGKDYKSLDDFVEKNRDKFESQE